MSGLLICILTKNEEENLPPVLSSLSGIDARVVVVDSGSEDRTVKIAEEAGADVVSHEFKSFAQQRNWVLGSLGADYDWVLFLDADERLSPELAAELATLPAPGVPNPVAYYVLREMRFLGRTLRHGGYGKNRVIRLMHPAKCTVYEHTRTIEYAKADGATGALTYPIIHENMKPLSDWIIKHDWYSTRDAEDLSRTTRDATEVTEGRMRLMAHRAMAKLTPPLFRPFLLFFYRYLVLGGFLDGREGFIYCALHDFWYPLLIAAKLIEAEKRASPPDVGHDRGD